MKLEKTTQSRIVRNALLSLFLYALPILLMFVTFYFTGQRPWEKKQPAKTSAVSAKNKPAQP
ncbi:hypothetical protein [Pedobacter hartonius]|uniref:Uncharacterized protein n=1 Tax=Pedobacter hartonius TaxID=425514 RepID=A0A1H3W4R8_9SPHI|nr:hypothetical protein [Pedobacter hartonius]SDZ82056.1 hypothetical protein SAMN05443550_10197 [Pedobacter hartonius]